MRKPLTNSVMLNAARKLLCGHLATRPASATEAEAIYSELTNEANRYLLQAGAIRRRNDGDDIAEALKLERHARAIELRAAAWQGDMGAAWEATRVEYEQRVAYYDRLCRAAS